MSHDADKQPIPGVLSLHTCSCLMHISICFQGCSNCHITWVVQDWIHQQQRHKAALETEIKTLRSQIGVACFAFDDSLMELQMQRTAAESELATVELQCISLVGFYEHQQFLQSELQKLSQQLNQLREQREDKHALVSNVTQALTR